MVEPRSAHSRRDIPQHDAIFLGGVQAHDALNDPSLRARKVHRPDIPQHDAIFLGGVQHHGVLHGPSLRARNVYLGDDLIGPALRARSVFLVGGAHVEAHALKESPNRSDIPQHDVLFLGGVQYQDALFLGGIHHQDALHDPYLHD